MELHITLNKKIGGFWDGGEKNFFTFSLGKVQKDSKGEYQRIHGWESNQWFHVAKGKTDKQTLSNAFRFIKGKMKKSKDIFIQHYEYVSKAI